MDINNVSTPAIFILNNFILRVHKIFFKDIIVFSVVFFTIV